MAILGLPLVIEQWGSLYVARDSTATFTLPLASNVFQLAYGKTDGDGSPPTITTTSSSITIAHASWPATYKLIIVGN